MIASLVIIVLSLIGMFDAGYISLQHFQGIIPPCTAGFECDTVLSSRYANIGPIPVSALGFVYYLSVFSLAILLYLDVQFKRTKATTTDVLRVLTVLGFVFTSYLIILMAYILDAWCIYCLVSAFTSTGIFLATLWLAKGEKGDSSFLRGAWFWLMATLYHYIAKPIFFLFDPESVHNTLVRAGMLMGSMRLTRFATRVTLGFQTPETAVQFAGIKFPNRVGLSAGYDYNGQLTGVLSEVGFGWHTIGTVTLEPYEGNTKPRLTRFPLSRSILVNKGLKNIGSEMIINQLAGKDFKIPTGISIASTNKGYDSDREQILDIVECFYRFETADMRHAYYELNISCPNTFGGEPFTTAKRLNQLLTILDKTVKKPIFVKMPIDLPEAQFLSILEACDKHTIAGVILGNLTKDKKNPDVDPTERDKWQTLPGNLSGKPTFNRSNKLIKLADKHYGKRFVIVGTGGIFSAKDAEIKLAAGADLVQLITGMIYQGPQLIGQINRELATTETQ